MMPLVHHRNITGYIITKRELDHMSKNNKNESTDVYYRLKEENKKRKIKIISNFIILVLTVVVIIFSLVNRGILFPDRYKEKTTEKIEENKKNAVEAIQSADNLVQVLDYLDSDYSWLSLRVYSELKNYEKVGRLVNYLEHNEYMIIDYEGEKYMILPYYCDPEKNGGKLYEVKNIEKNYKYYEESDSNVLKLKFTNDVVGDENYQGNYALCILKIDRDVAAVIVDGVEYNEFEGGKVEVAGKIGFVDKNMNIVIPFEFDSNSFDGERYVRLREDGNRVRTTGRIEESDENIIVPWINSYYLVQMVDKETGEGKIGIINQKGRLEHGYINGRISEICNAGSIDKRRIVFYVTVDGYKRYGVLDETLYELFEPQFKDIQIAIKHMNGYLVVETFNKDKEVYNFSGKKESFSADILLKEKD